MEEQFKNHNEIWVKIPSTNGLYSASNLGNIRSNGVVKKTVKGHLKQIKGRVLKQTINPWKYKYVSLSLLEHGKKVFSHRLIAEAFIPNPEKKSYINHINRDRGDNRVINLEWCTSRENQHHRNINESNSANCVGVSLKEGKYRARIWINGKNYTLGSYEVEEDACKSFTTALNNWEEKGQIPSYKRINKFSKHTGIVEHQGKFTASFKRNKKDNYVGYFENEKFAKYWLDKAIEDFNKNGVYTKYKKGDEEYPEK